MKKERIIEEMKHFIISIAFIFCILGFFGICFITFKAFTVQGYDIKMVDVLDVDKIDKVGCESNSMGMTLNCDDVVYGEYLEEGKPLDVGGIYVYEKKDFNNETYKVVHRLIKCVDYDCNMTVFKGDANVVGEFVKKEDIIYKVVRVTYG